MAKSRLKAFGILALVLSFAGSATLLAQSRNRGGGGGVARSPVTLPQRPRPQPSLSSNFNQRAANIISRQAGAAGQGSFTRRIALPATFARRLQASARMAAVRPPPGRAASWPVVVAQASSMKGLLRHEGQGKGQGGHVIVLHVGRTDAESKDRQRNPSSWSSISKIGTVSSFSNGSVATRAAAATLWGNQTDIRKWIGENPAIGSNRSFNMTAADAKKIGITGRSYTEGQSDLMDRTGARFILQYQGAGKYVILTGYPGDGS